MVAHITQPNRQIATNIIMLLAGAVVTQAFTLVALLLTARYLGIDVYGQYTASYTLLSQAVILLNFGLDTWLLREGAKSKQLLIQTASDSLLYKLLLAGPWLILVTIVATYLNPEVYLSAIIWVVALGFILQSIGTLIQTVFKSQLHNGITFWLQIVNSGILLLLTWWLTQKSSELAEFVWARTISLAGMAALGLYFFKQHYVFQPSWGHLRGVIRHSAPFFMAEALSYIYATADVTIIAIWLGKTDVGIYGPVIVLLNAIQIIPTAIHSVMLPVLSRAYHTAPATTRKPALLLIAGLGMIGFGLSSLTFILAEPLINLLYGPAFHQSAVILMLLSPIIGLKNLNFAFGTILTAINRQRDRVMAQTIIAVANVGLNLLIVNKYGVMGVALVYLITEFGLVIGYGSFAWRNSQGFRFLVIR